VPAADQRPATWPLTDPASVVVRVGGSTEFGYLGGIPRRCPVRPALLRSARPGSRGRGFERHQSDARDRSAKASTKSGLFQPFEHKFLRLLRTELRGERPGVKEWP